MDFIPPGCCSDVTGPDFSKMDIQKLEVFCLIFHINWCEQYFWLSVAAIFCLPHFCSMIHYSNWNLIFFLSRKTSLEVLGFSLNIFKLCKFHKMIMNQPSWEALQSDKVYILGFLLIVIGLILCGLCMRAYGPKDTFRQLGLPVWQACW
ncbi:uncharacterized protein LOC143290150 isoform X2 [Babylonia areolata]|uniref:uncharacterized protein LOC143290150 isoform X2 n=1 Tax=Babylonia areolata TaxID=304850 RepID=UPI003FCF6A8B